MAQHNSGSVFDRLLGICFRILIGAAAIYLAVRLIEAVWMALIVILGVGGFIALAVIVLRGRRNGW